MKLSLKKNENECLKLLNKKRKGILDEVHLKEKQLSRIDYLRYEKDLYIDVTFTFSFYL